MTSDAALEAWEEQYRLKEAELEKMLKNPEGEWEQTNLLAVARSERRRMCAAPAIRDLWRRFWYEETARHEQAPSPLTAAGPGGYESDPDARLAACAHLAAREDTSHSGRVHRLLDPLVLPSGSVANEMTPGDWWLDNNGAGARVVSDLGLLGGWDDEEKCWYCLGDPARRMESEAMAGAEVETEEGDAIAGAEGGGRRDLEEEMKEDKKGEGDGALKTCGNCRVAKYCRFSCLKAHRSEHRHDCEILRRHRKFGTPVPLCGFCGKILGTPGAKLLRCARCKIQTYCSKECQTSHWSGSGGMIPGGGHKTTCKKAQ